MQGIVTKISRPKKLLANSVRGPVFGLKGQIVLLTALAILHAPDVYSESVKKIEKPELEIILPAQVLDSQCERFAKLFTRSRGLLATGPFHKATCLTKSVNTKSPQSKSPKSKSLWQMKISESEDGIRFEVFYDIEIPILVASLTLEDVTSVQETFSDHKIMPLIALYINLSLPMQGVLSRNELLARSINGRPSRNITFPNLVLYTLTFDPQSKLWIPNVVGGAALTSKDTKNSNGRPYVRWNLQVDSISPRAQTYFYRQTEDISEELAVLKKHIISRQESLATKFLKLGRSAYTGFRIGKEVSKSSDLVTQAPMIGAFCEFRSGILDGLRINYDVIPKRAISIELREESYEWSRVQLGYAFGSKLSLPVFNWFDMTPRLGITNLNYNLKTFPSQTDSESDGSEGTIFVTELVQQRAPTFGLELGLETRANLVLLRYWFYSSYSTGVLKVDKKYSTSSIRLGLDIYHDLVDVGPFKLAVVGFASYDDTFIKTLNVESADPPSEADNESNVAIVKDGLVSLTIRTVYVGAGVTLRW